MWNKIKKFFEPSERDNERLERSKQETGSHHKLTIEHFDKAVNPKEKVEEVQVTKHMSIKQKKKKSKPVNYNF